MSKKGNQPAFPRPMGHAPNMGCEYNGPQEGMTLRDYFAGQALIGLAKLSGYAKDCERTAELAYNLADAMIEARESIEESD